MLRLLTCGDPSCWLLTGTSGEKQLEVKPTHGLQRGAAAKNGRRSRASGRSGCAWRPATIRSSARALPSALDSEGISKSEFLASYEEMLIQSFENAALTNCTVH